MTTCFEQMTEKEQLIYFAGLCDGEAFIGLSTHGKGLRPILQINMTDRPILEFFGNKFNLKLVELNSPSRIAKRVERGHKQLYQIRAECKKAHPIIKLIYPYLSVKKEAAARALAYYDNETRVCHNCGNTIDHTRNKRSLYCSIPCQHNAKNKRQYYKNKGL